MLQPQENLVKRPLQKIGLLFFGALCIFTVLGLGRFSYGVLLPYIKQDLLLTYSEVSFMTSFVFLGYLGGAILSGHAVLVIGIKRVMLIGFSLMSVGSFAMLTESGLWILCASSLLIGIGGASIYVPVSGYLPNLFPKKNKGFVLGVMNMGGGVGVSVCGWVIPLALKSGFFNSWRIGFIYIGLFILGLATCAIIFSRFIFRNSLKEELELEKENEHTAWSLVYSNKLMRKVGLIYATFGMSYLVYMNYFTDYLITTRNFSPTSAGQVLAIGGFFVSFSSLLGGTIADKWGRLRMLIVAYSIQAFVIISIGFTESHVLFILEAALFGVVMLSVPTVTLSTVSHMVPKKYSAAAMGFVTLLFGIGQFLSPIFSGIILDTFKSYTVLFSLAGLTYIFGLIGIILLPKKLND